MVHFIKLIRPINLMIIALTMYLVRHFVIGAILDDLNHTYSTGIELLFGDLDFFLLVLSTVMIAAAGNIINDYFDLRADRINKPEKIIVHRHIKRRVAMLAHSLLNFAAISIGFYVAWRTGFWPLAVVHIFSTSVLWFYSLYLKRKFLVGNLAVALLSGLVPLIVGAAEVPLLHYAKILPVEYIWSMIIFVFGFSFFAFWTNLIREVQKDAADVKGDKAMGCKTVPIVWGVEKTKRFILVLICILVALLIPISQFYVPDANYISTLWLLGPVAITMLWSAWETLNAQDRNGFQRASNIMKLSMLCGILYSIVFWYQINHLLYA